MTAPVKSDTDELLERAEQAFKSFDVNGDGKLTGRELRDVFKLIGSVKSDEEIEQMIKEADDNANGTIEYAEFMKIVLQSPPPRTSTDIRPVPSVTDTPETSSAATVAAPSLQSIAGGSSTTVKGWIRKRKAKKMLTSWKRRWFVLSKYEILYYKNEKEDKVRGKIPLATATLSLVPSLHRKDTGENLASNGNGNNKDKEKEKKGLRHSASKGEVPSHTRRKSHDENLAFVFEISTPKLGYLMSVDSVEEYNKWVKGIQCAIDRLVSLNQFKSSMRLGTKEVEAKVTTAVDTKGNSNVTQTPTADNPKIQLLIKPLHKENPIFALQSDKRVLVKEVLKKATGEDNPSYFFLVDGFLIPKYSNSLVVTVTADTCNLDPSNPTISEKTPLIHYYNDFLKQHNLSDKTRLRFDVDDGALRVDGGGGMTIRFKRTLKVPTEKQPAQYPPIVGDVDVHTMSECISIPSKWDNKGGVFLPLWQSEAACMYINAPSGAHHAVKIAVGNTNAISAQPWVKKLCKNPQDYLVTPAQHWFLGVSGYSHLRQIVSKRVKDPEKEMDFAVPLQILVMPLLRHDVHFHHYLCGKREDFDLYSSPKKLGLKPGDKIVMESQVLPQRVVVLEEFDLYNNTQLEVTSIPLHSLDKMNATNTDAWGAIRKNIREGTNQTQGGNHTTNTTTNTTITTHSNSTPQKSDPNGSLSKDEKMRVKVRTRSFSWEQTFDVTPSVTLSKFRKFIKKSYPPISNRDQIDTNTETPFALTLNNVPITNDEISLMGFIATHHKGPNEPIIELKVEKHPDLKDVHDHRKETTFAADRCALVQSITPDPLSPLAYDKKRAIRAYVHIVDSTLFTFLTRKPIPHPPIFQIKYTLEHIPYLEDYQDANESKFKEKKGASITDSTTLKTTPGHKKTRSWQEWVI